MLLRSLLRGVALAIAIGGIADPALTRDMAVSEPLSIVAVGDGSVAAAQALRRALGGDVEARVDVHAVPSRAAACPADGACVLVSDGAVPDRLTAGARVLGALLTPAPRVITRIDAPARAHLRASSSMRVTLAEGGKTVEVWDGNVRVGSAAAEGRTVDLPWVPLETGPRALRVVAGNESVDVGIVVDDVPVRLLFYEPQATWSGTFLRRALEDDPRFELAGRTQVAPPVAISRGAVTQLTPAALDQVAVVVLTAPESVSATDVQLLDKYVRRRGGSLLVIPDRRPTGPITTILPAIREERRESEPRAVGALRATQFLVFEPAVDVSTLDDFADRSVVVSRLLGRGQVIVSGALDAWKHRGDGAFESYWRSLVWDAAATAGPRLRLTAEQVVARRGGEVRVVVEVQTVSDLAREITAVAEYSCATDHGFLRLWPQPRHGSFTGVFRPRQVGDCRITASVAGLSGATSIAVRDDARHIRPSDRLEAAIAAYGGVVSAPGGEDRLLARIRQTLLEKEPSGAPATTYPMRSPLWLLPFAACLGTEWFLRRRAGAR